jgi:hypothetical protein
MAMFVENSRHDRFINLSLAREIVELEDRPGENKSSPFHRYKVVYGDNDYEIFWSTPRAVAASAATIIPATANDVLVVVWGELEADGKPWTMIERHKIVAWSFAPGCREADPLTASEGFIENTESRISAILRPDGKLDVPFDAVYDDEAAMVAALEKKLLEKTVK